MNYKKKSRRKYCQLWATNISIIDRIQLLYELGWCKNNCGFCYFKLWCGFGNKLLFNYYLSIIYYVVAERTLYFCLARKLIWLLWLSHIFTQWGWLILFSPDHFPGQHKNGESPPNYLFLRTFWAGRAYFLSVPFIAAESQHHEESCLIYGPFESTLLD